jgi:hypothetical protein
MDQLQRLAPVAGGLVRGVETRERVDQDGRRDGGRDDLHPPAGDPEQPRERLAVQVLHDDEELPILGDDVQRRGDVGVLDARRQPRLVEQHRHERGIRGEVRVKPLDRHRPREPRGPEEAPEVDRRHAAAGELVAQRVATDEQRRCGHWPRR